MAKKKKSDQLSVIGLVSAVLKSTSQQRSLKKAREKREAPPQPKVKKPKDTRTPEQIRTEVDSTRAQLVDTVARVKYDLDVPARARDLKVRVAARMPAVLKGDVQAAAVAASVLVAGLGTIVWGATASARR